ncbi:hypothetical protein GOBAR_DD27570 [Gossypium barbadense]|nr:hypothetical protein GOBAR_DD27570 [Gossypium barbadense]
MESGKGDTASVGDNGRRSAKKVRWRSEDPPNPDNPIVNDKIYQFIAKCMNDYFLVNFQDDDEYLHAVSGGPWTIFGQYLTVRPWAPSFTTDQEFPTSLLVWIKLLRLPEGMYTISLLKFIGSIIGPFARLAVYIDLGKFLESMSLVCFGCGRFGHSCDACLHRLEKGETTEGVTAGNLDNDTVAQGGITDRSSNKDAIAHGSRFSVLSKNYDEVEGIKCTALNGSTGIKGSDGAILGKVLPARGKLLSNLQIKYKVLKKKSSKNKGKAIVLVNGPKTNSNVLKPTNNQGP